MKEWFIVQVFLKGGPVMVPILVCSIVALAVLIERFRYFQKSSGNPEVLMRKVRGALTARDYTESLNICRREEGPVASVVKVGLEHLDRPKDALLDVMRQEALRQMKRVEARHGVLSTIAAISPLLGLTGTITGMIASFQIISTIGVGDPTALAGGISEALYTTAAGLFVGIPTLAAYNWCESRVNDFSEQVEYCSLDLVNFLQGAEDPGEKASA
jgi:biopolymer transport protein ExbB